MPLMTRRVHPLDAADIRRQERLDPLPLLVAQPKQIPAHNFKSFPPKNHYLIVSEKGLMSSDPSLPLCRFRSAMRGVAKLYHEGSIRERKSAGGAATAS